MDEIKKIGFKWNNDSVKFNDDGSIDKQVEGKGTGLASIFERIANEGGQKNKIDTADEKQAVKDLYKLLEHGEVDKQTEKSLMDELFKSGNIINTIKAKIAQIKAEENKLDLDIVGIVANTMSEKNVNTAKSIAQKYKVDSGDTLYSLAKSTLPPNATFDDIQRQAIYISAMNGSATTFQVGQEILLPKAETSTVDNANQPENNGVEFATTESNQEARLTGFKAPNMNGKPSADIVQMQIDAYLQRLGVVEEAKNITIDLANFVSGEKGQEALNKMQFKNSAQEDTWLVSELGVMNEFLKGDLTQVPEGLSDNAFSIIKDTKFNKDQLKELANFISNDVKGKDVNELADALKVDLKDIVPKDLLTKIANEKDLKTKTTKVIETYNNIVSAKTVLAQNLKTRNENVATNNQVISDSSASILEKKRYKQALLKQGYTVDSKEIKKIDKDIKNHEDNIENAKAKNLENIKIIIQARALYEALEQIRVALEGPKKQLEKAVNTLNDIDAFDKAAEAKAKDVNKTEKSQRNTEKRQFNYSEFTSGIENKQQSKTVDKIIELTPNVSLDESTEKREDAAAANATSAEEANELASAEQKLKNYTERLEDYENMKNETNRAKILTFENDILEARNDLKKGDFRVRLNKDDALQIQYAGKNYEGADIETFKNGKVSLVDLTSIPKFEADQFVQFINGKKPEWAKAEGVTFEVKADPYNETRSIVVNGTEYTEDADIQALLNSTELPNKSNVNQVAAATVTLYLNEVLKALRQDGDNRITDDVFKEEVKAIIDGDKVKVTLAGVEYDKDVFMSIVSVNKNLIREIIGYSSAYRTSYPEQFDKIELKAEKGQVAYYYDGAKYESRDAFVAHLNKIK